MTIFCVISFIVLLLSTVTVSYFAEMVPLLGEYIIPLAIVSAALGLSALLFVIAKLKNAFEGKDKKEKSK